ncbi:MAG: TolB family protein [Gaiellaceae bacterium]
MNRPLTALAIALLIAPLLLAGSASGAPAKFQNGQISFWSDRMADRAQVYVMNADGGRQHAITRQFSAKRGAFSRDGRRIAFDGRAYNTLFDFDIFVAAASGRGAKRITRGPERDLMPAWSPDGRTIAFSRQAAEEDMPEIWLVGADGSDPRLLLQGGLAPSWSPDGSRIAFEGLGGVATVKPDGSALRQLASGGEPAWSPDGRTIVFTRAGDIWLMRPDGSGQRRLTRTAAEELEPSFSPDGRWVLVSSDRIGNKDVFKMRPDGSGLRNLTRHPAEDWATSWQPLPH